MPKVIKPGTVTVKPDGHVIVEGFEIEYVDDELSGCEENFNAGATWALQQIAEALAPGNKHLGAVG